MEGLARGEIERDPARAQRCFGRSRDGTGEPRRLLPPGRATGGERAAGSVAASDAFFPFADGPEILLAAGVSAIVQPGGSVRDGEVIAAVQAAGATMYFTGARHFFH